MKVSHRGLGMYIDGALPEPSEVARLLNLHAFEVESVEEVHGDSVIDVDVLPDRAHYALAHRGIALELSAILGLPMKSLEMKYETGEVAPLAIAIKAPDFCDRYIGRRIENVVVGESPEWVKSVLEAIGERSINSVVDATNFIMLGIGQPMHAFDADKVVGDIVVRAAEDGEKITLLDGAEVELNDSDHVIADQDGALAIAGVKGGARAEVTKETKNVILEAAHFDPARVRQTSRRLRIINNSSKRFENAVAISQTDKAMDLCSALIKEASKDARVGSVVVAGEGEYTTKSVEVTHAYIESRLGATLSKDDVVRILSAIECQVTEDNDAYTVIPAIYRRDLNTPEDVVEEVGRLHGYHHIEGVLPEKIAVPEMGEFEGLMALKQLLAREGFYEVFTSTFRKKGDVKVIRPVAKDKAYLRTNLAKNMEEALEKGIYNSDLIGIDRVRVFEIGKVFAEGQEELHLCIGISGKKADGKCNEVLNEINDAFGTALEGRVAQGILEVSLEGVMLSPESFVAPQPLQSKPFKTLSPYPIITRDIALFVPAGVSAKEIEEMTVKEAGELLVNHRLFDSFEKDGRQSYAFRLVFQSYEKTLTDEEVGESMNRIVDVLESKGFEIR